MTSIRIKPGLLGGRVEPPASKSDAHRALFAAALAGQPSMIDGLTDPLSDDIIATRRCLEDLLNGSDILDCGESGTTLRLLIPVSGAVSPKKRSKTLTFTGHGRLVNRPLKEYQAILQPHGLTLQYPQDRSLPMQLSGRLQPGVYRVPGHISSQYISGLLMALPLLEEPSDICLTSALESAPYVAMTCRTLKYFGIDIELRPDGYHIPAPQQYQSNRYFVERDYSQAAFWLTAAYGGCDLEVTGLPAETAQGDQAILDYLSALRGQQPTYTFDLSQTPDLVPILAVAAMITPAVTRLTHIGRLRLKESDRIEAVRATLSAIGGDVESDEDMLVIYGGSTSRKHSVLNGGTVDSWGDHRIAMALAIAALFTRDGIVLNQAEAVQKSYPDFFQVFKQLGGDLFELTMGAKHQNQLIW